MEKYLSFNFWLNTRPEPLHGVGLNIMLYIIIALLIIAIAGTICSLNQLRIPKRIINKIKIFCFTNTFIALLFLFFSYELIPYFRARFLYIVWFIIAIIWLWKIFFPSRKNGSKSSVRDDEIKKYLPK